MPLKEASEEIKTYDKLVTRSEPLDSRHDYEFRLYRGDPDVYNISVEEGEWEEIIPNRCKAEVNRVIEDLAFSDIQLLIPIADEDSRDRGKITKTEYTALGILNLADQILRDSSTGSTLRALLAKYWVLRGWSVKRFILREEDGKLIPDLAIWDIRNTKYIEGKKRLTWVGYKRWVTKDEIEDEFGDTWNGTVDENGLVIIHDIWKCDDPSKPAQEGVIIGKEYVKKETVKVGNFPLDYLPVNISSTRGMPLIQDSNSDNIKYTGQSYITNNSTLFPIEAQLMSMFLTAAKHDAKAPIVINWNGKGQSPAGKFRDTDPNVAGRVIVLDTSLGEELAGPMPPSNTSNIAQMIGVLRGQLGIGGMNDISFGTLDKALPAQGIDILSHAAMANEKPFLFGMQSDYEWLAGEATRQYKMGNFKEQEFQGIDKSQNPFIATIKPKQIDDTWKFKCRLVPDIIRDKSAMIQIARMATEGDKPIMSMQTALDQLQIVLDPDSEMEKISRERADAVFGIGVVEAFVSKVKDYAKDTGIKMTDKQAKRFVIDFAFKNMMTSMQSQQSQGSPQQNPANKSSQITASNAEGRIPPPIVEAAKKEAGVA